jgi:hypothetical protein
VVLILCAFSKVVLLVGEIKVKNDLKKLVLNTSFLCLFSVYSFVSAMEANIKEEENPRVTLAEEIKTYAKKQIVLAEEIQKSELVAKDQQSLITAHTNFLEYIFTANRNFKDFRLIRAEYQFKKGIISQEDLDEIRGEVANSTVVGSLPTHLNAVLNGGISAGVRADQYNASISPLILASEARLVVDPNQSSPNRTVSRGNIPAATIDQEELDEFMRALKLK